MLRMKVESSAKAACLPVLARSYPFRLRFPAPSPMMVLLYFAGYVREGIVREL